MKNLLIIAIALTSVNAFATRARMLSLGNSVHLVDAMSVFDRPTDVFKLGSDYVTLETGATGGVAATTQNANAEGMVVRTMGNAKMGLALGHQSTNASSWGLRKSAALFAGTGNLAVNQQNPIAFMYGTKAGDITYTGSVGYSNYNNKAATTTTVEKESSMGFNFGATSGAWDVTFASGLTNSAQLANGTKLTGTSALTLSGGYQIETMYVFGKYSTAGVKYEDSAATELGKYDATITTVGVVNSHKKDGSELFYSIAYSMDDAKTSTQKNSTTTLPITIGFEADATSWLALRGSVTQSTLINKTKNEITGTTKDVDPSENSTTVAAGAGLKFNKLAVDGTILNTTASTTGKKLDSSELLAQVGMTYNF